MLSFKKGKNGRVLAEIDGGKHNGKVLYVNEKEDNKESFVTKKKKTKYRDDEEEEDTDDGMFELEDPMLYLREDDLRFPTDRGSKRIGLLKREKLKKALMTGSRPYEDELMDIYDDKKKFLDEKLKTELVLPEGLVVPLPDPKKRMTIYVSGAAGAGKSTYVSKFAKNYKRIFPKNPVFIFSRLAKDETLDSIDRSQRIPIDQVLVDEPIDPEELNNSLVIFDDIDTIPDKAQRKAVADLRKDLLLTGRHQNVYVASTSHQLCNYMETRDLLNEAHAVTFFPDAGSLTGMKRFLQTYCGVDNKMRDKIMNLRSRWITICKHYPQVCLHEHGAFLIK